MRKAGYLWTVVLLSLTAAISLPSFGDTKGTEILRQAFKQLEDAKTMTADMIAEAKIPVPPANLRWKGKITLMKPNFIKVEMEGNGAPSFYGDGKNYFMVAQGQSRRRSLKAAPVELPGIWEGEIDAFFGGEKLVDKVTATAAGSKKIGKVECDLVKVEMKNPDRTAVYAIGKKDRLIYQADISIPVPNGFTRSQTNTMSDIKFNAPLKPVSFAFTPPPDPTEAKLIPEGKEAPDFNLPTPTGENLGLSDILKGKRAVLVNFWFYA